MKKKLKAKKRPNPADLTRRNNEARKKETKTLKLEAKMLEKRVRVLESQMEHVYDICFNP